MQGSPLGYQTWAIAIYLVATNLKGVSSMKLHRDLGISQKSAWHLAHRIREAWKFDNGPFPGPVEIDEANFGSRRKNTSHSKRKRFSGAGPLAGKTVVASAKDRRTNKVSAAVVEDTTGSVANLTKGRGAPGRKTCSTYVSALARRSCSNVMASVRTHGPTPKARSTILASPTMPPWMANIRAWPLRSARITSKPLIVA